MVEKEILITKPYIELPAVKPLQGAVAIDGENQDKTMILEVYEKETGVKITEFTIPADPKFNARFSVKNFTGKTLILKGCGSEAFFAGIQQVDCEFEESEYDFSNESLPRPEYHFTALKGWINDPNGLVYKDGIYHLYFQYNPFDVQWQNMSWGHAVSKDLINWKQLDTVMYTDENGYMFSGSGFVNTRENLNLSKDTLLFYYTAAAEGRKWFEGKAFTQRMAYSIDNGKTFIKSDKGIVDTISHENRDPKVFWHEKSDSYVMILWVDGNEFAILRSENLEKWEISQRFKLDGGFECPDLICLYEAGDRTNEHWFVTTADGYYYPGVFDGYTFKWNGSRHCLYMNKVPYAAQTYSNTDGRTILVPWLRVEFPERIYTGAMGIPRELELVKISGIESGYKQDENASYRIALKPVREFAEKGYADKFISCNCDKDGENYFCVAGIDITYDKLTGKLNIAGGKETTQIKSGLNKITVFVDNGIVEVTAYCDTMLGIYEV